MPYYLAEYTGSGKRTDPFRPVGTDPTFSSIDLRPDSSVRDGYALVFTPDETKGMRKIGDGPFDTLGTRVKDRVHNRLGVDISHAKRLDVLVATLMMRPNGWKPLRPAGWQYEIWLGGLLWTFPLLSGGASDTFNRANETPLAAPWVNSALAGDIDATNNLTSNTVQVTSGIGTSYYPNAASSGNQYSQAELGGRDAGIIVRAAVGTTAFNLYCFEGFAGSFRIDKVTNGGFTQLVVTSSGNPGPEIRRLEAIGSTITAYRAGVQDGSPATDTTYTTGQPGIFAQSNATHYVDNWSGGDLVVAPSILVPRHALGGGRW